MSTDTPFSERRTLSGEHSVRPLAHQTDGSACLHTRLFSVLKVELEIHGVTARSIINVQWNQEELRIEGEMGDVQHLEDVVQTDGFDCWHEFKGLFA